MIKQDLSDINLPGIGNYFYANTIDGQFGFVVDFHTATKVQKPTETKLLSGSITLLTEVVSGSGGRLEVLKSIVNSSFELLKVKTMEYIIFPDGYIYSTQKQKFGLPEGQSREWTKKVKIHANWPAGEYQYVMSYIDLLTGERGEVKVPFTKL